LARQMVVGQRVEDITRQLLAAIPKQRTNKCTVQEGLCGNKWILDIRGALTVGVIYRDDRRVPSLSGYSE
jgi:hypothetical protein